MSALPPFLSNEEIFAIVHPLVQPAAIVRWFKANGFPDIKVRPNGLPLIARTKFEEVYGARQMPMSMAVESGETPDVQALLERIGRNANSKTVSK